MARALAILGSARCDGHTAALLKRLIGGSDCEVIDLNAANIARFRYDQRYADDDEFMAIVEKMIAAPIVIFATPVYWYSYSTVMKNFIDRLSDLLMSQKAVGRRLRGGRWALVSSGSDSEPDRDLFSTFRRACEYLGVQCVAEVYGVEGGAFVDEAAAKMIRAHLG
ncbi:MAG: flavodoxin family protein [Phycisphaerales bacterium]